MAEDDKPEINLRKFEWNPNATFAKAAASAGQKPPDPDEDKPLWARIWARPLGRAAVLGLLMLLGGGLFALTMLKAGEAAPSGGTFAGVASSLKLRFGGRDRMSNIPEDRGPAPAARISFVKNRHMAGDPTADEFKVEVPEIQIPLPPAGAPGGGAGAGGGGSSAAQAAAAAPQPRLDQNRSLDGGFVNAPRFNSSLSRVGGRTLEARALSRGDARRSIGASAGAAGGSGAGAGGKAQAPLTAFAKDNPDALKAAKADRAGEAAGVGGGGGGGGGGTPAPPEGTDPTDAAISQIRGLLDGARGDRDKAEDEEKKAKALAAGGHMPQAHYHYDRAEKKRDSAEDKENQARKISDDLVNATGDLNQRRITRYCIDKGIRDGTPVAQCDPPVDDKGMYIGP